MPEGSGIAACGIQHKAAVILLLVQNDTDFGDASLDAGPRCKLSGVQVDRAAFCEHVAGFVTVYLHGYSPVADVGQCSPGNRHGFRPK